MKEQSKQRRAVASKRTIATAVKRKPDSLSHSAECGSSLPAAKSREQLEEAACQSICVLTGTSGKVVSMRLMNQVASALAHPAISEGQVLLTAVATIGEMKPKSFTEGMLAAQMIASHEAGLMFMMRATLKDQTTEGIDLNVNRASRLMRVFNEQVEAMLKLKGMTGQQKMVVEHIHIHDGGQAIVGNIEGKGGRGCKE